MVPPWVHTCRRLTNWSLKRLNASKVVVRLNKPNLKTCFRYYYKFRLLRLNLDAPSKYLVTEVRELKFYLKNTQLSITNLFLASIYLNNFCSRTFGTHVVQNEKNRRIHHKLLLRLYDPWWNRCKIFVGTVAQKLI